MKEAELRKQIQATRQDLQNEFVRAECHDEFARRFDAHLDDFVEIYDRVKTCLETRAARAAVTARNLLTLANDVTAAKALAASKFPPRVYIVGEAAAYFIGRIDDFRAMDVVVLTNTGARQKSWFGSENHKTPLRDHIEYEHTSHATGTKYTVRICINEFPLQRHVFAHHCAVAFGLVGTPRSAELLIDECECWWHERKTYDELDASQRHDLLQSRSQSVEHRERCAGSLKRSGRKLWSTVKRLQTVRRQPDRLLERGPASNVLKSRQMVSVERFCCTRPKACDWTRRVGVSSTSTCYMYTMTMIFAMAGSNLFDNFIEQITWHQGLVRAHRKRRSRINFVRHYCIVCSARELLLQATIDHWRFEATESLQSCGFREMCLSYADDPRLQPESHAQRQRFCEHDIFAVTDDHQRIKRICLRWRLRAALRRYARLVREFRRSVLDTKFGSK